jgi:PAS domain-containing protein
MVNKLASFHSIMEPLPDATLVDDDERRIVERNSATKQLFGYTPDELRGLPLNTLIPAEYRRAHGWHVADFGSNGGRRLMGKRLAVFGLTGQIGASIGGVIGPEPGRMSSELLRRADVVATYRAKQRGVPFCLCEAPLNMALAMGLCRWLKAAI